MNKEDKKEFEKDRKRYLQMVARIITERDELQEAYNIAMEEIKRLRVKLGYDKK